MMIELTLLVLCVANIILTFSYSRKVLKVLNEKNIEQISQPENDIHSILNNRLIDLQSRRYSVQSKVIRKKDGA